jgi:NAD(P)-dependent dehydrogenase (short-subunit alcohol dehydrogenase family)
MSSSLKGRFIVITGATRGLGRALAHEFARLGHTVAGCGRSAEHIESLRRELPPHDFSVLDVTDDDAVEAWASRLVEAFGAPQLLLNNAALINRNAPLWRVSAEEFGAVMDVNLKGVANVVRWFAPPMIARKSGVIVNFSSGWGRSTDSDVAPYCATKWAIEGLTRALAQELPEGLVAVPLNPGVINTDMLQSCFGPSAAGFPSPAQWAQTAAPFLLKLGPKDNGRPLTVP